MLPHVDPVDPTPLDDLQRVAKDDFVNGLMIGQFHPTCETLGSVWNPDFPALRAPIPLLAIRKLVVFDLPFPDSPLVGSSSPIAGKPAKYSLGQYRTPDGSTQIGVRCD